MKADERPGGTIDGVREEGQGPVIPDRRRPRGFLYSEAQVVVAALLGSLLAGAFLLYKNEKNMRDASRFYFIIAVLALFTVSFITTLFGAVVAGAYRNVVAHLVNLALIWYWFRRTQRDDVADHLASGNTRQKPWWRVFAVVLCVYAIVFVVAVVLIFFLNVLGAVITGNVPFFL